MEFSKQNLILIVDDRPTNLKIIFDFLKESGFKILVAKDGESALEKVQEVLPDLILLDVMMPGIDGFETCIRLKASPRTKDIPVIFMTALNDLVSKVKGLSLGAVDYITKPFQQEEVLARVKLQLKLHCLTQTLEEQNLLLKQEIAARLHAEAELQQFAQELEQRVQDRTAELTHALQNLQATQTQLEIERGKLEAVLRQMPAGVVIAEAPSGKLILGNEQSEQILGHAFPSLENVEQSCVYNRFRNDGQIYTSLELPLARSIATGEIVLGEEINFHRSDGTLGTVRVNSAPIRNGEGQIVAGVETFYDITENKQAESKLKASLKEKEVLLKEIHHRVKNNLQIISSLLNLQSAYINDRQVLEIFKNSENRILSIALIHEQLYQSQDLATIDLSDYLHNLVVNLVAAYENNSDLFNIKINIEKPIFLGVDAAVPCGLIINELVLNSIKHAFSEDEIGEICISIRAEEREIILIVKDNGRGIAEEFDWKNTKTLGFQLAIALTHQLEGSMEVHRNEGTEVKITFTI